MTLLAGNAPGRGLVIGMGLGTVFTGLICIIVICYIMGAVIKAVEKRKPAKSAEASVPAPQASVSAPAPIENKGELVAVISAVIAEELGEDVEAIRIKSIRRVS